ncbi:hypothetical protein ACWM0J_09905 [Pediococcus acidilactici]
MSNKNSSKKFTTLLRSTFAFSLATVGIVSAPLLKNTVLHCRLPLAELIAHADETPDLSSIYYDDDTNMFTSRDKSWSVKVNGRIYSLLINHLGSYRSVTPDTEGVMLFKLDSPPVNATYTLTVGDQVINTGAIHPINLNGHTYYGATLSKTIIQKLVHEVVRTKTSGRIKFTNIPEVLPISDFPMDVNTILNVSLPTAEYYTDEQSLADHIAGLKLSLTDPDGKVVNKVSIEKDWIETDKNSNLPGTYQYTLNNLGKQALRKKLGDMGGDYWVYHQHYTLGDVGTGKVTVLPKNPTEVTATVSYVDATTGKTVATDKIKGLINDVGIYQVHLPKGYQLATGQLQKIKYRLTISRSANLTVKVIQASDDSSDSSDSGDNSSSGDDHSSSDNGSSSDGHSSSDDSSSSDDHSSSDNSSSGDDHSSSDDSSSGDDHSSPDNVPLVTVTLHQMVVHLVMIILRRITAPLATTTLRQTIVHPVTTILQKIMVLVRITTKVTILMNLVQLALVTVRLRRTIPRILRVPRLAIIIQVTILTIKEVHGILRTERHQVPIKRLLFLQNEAR